MSKCSNEQFQVKKKTKNDSNTRTLLKRLKATKTKTKTKTTTTTVGKTIITTRTKGTKRRRRRRRNGLSRSKLEQQQAPPLLVRLDDFYIIRTSESLAVAAAYVGTTNNSIGRIRGDAHDAQAGQNRQPQEPTMPLSQGSYAKVTPAQRRAALSVKLQDAAVAPPPKRSRKFSENFNNYSTNNNNNNSMFLFTSPPPVGVMTTTTPNQQQQQPQQQQQHNQLHTSLLDFGESLARCGRLQESFAIYALIASEHSDGYVPVDRLHVLSSALAAHVRQLSGSGSRKAVPLAAATDATSPLFSAALESNSAKSQFTASSWSGAADGGAGGGAVNAAQIVPDAVVGTNLHKATRELARVPSPAVCAHDDEDDVDDWDPLTCPLCRDILRCPVTTNCGHTFCRQCCETITKCNVCHMKFPRAHLDDFVAVAKNARPVATTTTTTASTFYHGSSVGGGVTAHYNYYAPTAATVTTAVPALAVERAPALLPQHGIGVTAQQWPAVTGVVRLRYAAVAAAATSPPTTTVTTTTVASTTATATTTMASTSPGAADGASVGAGMSAGVPAGSAVNMKFMPDVLVRRLVEKWWGADVQAQKISETAASYMHSNLLDDALRYCNASLEKSPTNFKSLLLRAEVLLKMNHYQSSLADVENALKGRYTSAKAHYLRALALSEVGRFDEALFDNCLAISLDRTADLTGSELFKHILSKNLQRLLAQSPKSRSPPSYVHRSCVADAASYGALAEHWLRRKQRLVLLNHAAPYDDQGNEYVGCGLQRCDIIADEDVVVDAEAAVMLGVEMDVDMELGMDVGVDMEFIKCADKRIAEQQDYAELTWRRQTQSRKHFRRKWMTKGTELLPSPTLDDDERCSAQFRGILQRTQQEVQRLKKIEYSDDLARKQYAQVAASLIDASDFECVLCCRTFWKPVVTPCGHTYCWVCLDRCMDYNSSCPLCMSPLVEPNVNLYQGSSSPVPFIVAKRPVTKFLEAAMKRFIPDSYAKRFRQEIDMEPSVPVFICTTAFPYVPCPLFVYEPRYRLMVRRAVESGEKQFGIVQPHSGKARYFDVGTILDIRDCVMLGDGCSILSTVGCKRFKILARSEKDGYETAKVEYIYDETIADEHVQFVSNMHEAVLAKAVEWFDSLSLETKQEILQSFGQMPSVEENWERIADGPAWAWWIIALLPLSQQLKVDILATTSLEKRLRAIEKTLDYLSRTLRRAQQDCSVVVVQQQQQHQQHQQHQQQQQQQQQQQCDQSSVAVDGGDEGELSTANECCQLTVSGGHAANEVLQEASDETRHSNATSSEQHQLLL